MRRSPQETVESNRQITRRALVMGGLQIGFAGALGFRMHHLQVEQANQFRLLAEENRVRFHLLPPARGMIFDRDGRIIAGNEPSYGIVMVREEAGDVEQALHRLSALVDLDKDTVARALTEMRRTAPYLPVTVANGITWEEMSRVAVNAPALPGISPQVGLRRIYPMGSDYAHVVGRVGAVSADDLKKYENPDPLLRIPRFQFGKIGVEAELEDELRGTAGIKRVEVNASGRIMRELGRRAGKPGVNIQLSVDSRLQSYVSARLGQESASAVVLDCQNGDVLSIMSSPSYDPNIFLGGISVSDFNALLENDHRPLASKTVQDSYSPGSTFKMVVALAALEEGVVTPDDTFSCKGHIELHSRKFHCWNKSGHGNVDLNRSIRESCDVYYYELAQKIGIEKIAAMARRLGLGIVHAVPMSGVIRGLIPTKDWKLKTHKAEWVPGDTVNASIGQGFVSCSPLQLAVMTARLATGRSVTPRLIRTIDGVEQPSGAGTALGLNENNLRHIRRGMDSVVNNRRGTAFSSRVLADDMRIAGKTGTTQVRNISELERARGVIRNEDLPWKQRDHALFVNYAPADDPKIAVAVVVEHGGGGSRAAAPVARDITLQALYGKDPPLTAYPSSARARIRAQQERLARERRDLPTSTRERT